MFAGSVGAVLTARMDLSRLREAYEMAGLEEANLADDPVAQFQQWFAEVEAAADREVHDRYGIDAVPLVLVIDGEGVVRDHHLGPVSSTHLWASLAEVRQPGSVPGDCSAS